MPGSTPSSARGRGHQVYDVRGPKNGRAPAIGRASGIGQAGPAKLKTVRTASLLTARGIRVGV